MGKHWLVVITEIQGMVAKLPDLREVRFLYLRELGDMTDILMHICSQPEVRFI